MLSEITVNKKGEKIIFIDTLEKLIDISEFAGEHREEFEDLWKVQGVKYIALTDELSNYMDKVMDFVGVPRAEAAYRASIDDL